MAVRGFTRWERPPRITGIAPYSSPYSLCAAANHSGRLIPGHWNMRKNRGNVAKMIVLIPLSVPAVTRASMGGATSLVDEKISATVFKVI